MSAFKLFNVNSSGIRPRAFLGFSELHCIPGGFLQDINGEVIGCVQRETGRQRQALWGLNGEHLAERP